MKKFMLFMLSSTLVLHACKKDKKDDTPPTTQPYKCTTCVETPEAKEAFNNSSAGVYKGVIVGSTGTIALYLYNTGTEVKALVAFDGQSGTLSTTSLSAWQPGQPISNAVFTGTINNQQVQATFSVEANGQNPTVSVQIPGHTVSVAIYKETSTTLIKNFEGTYTGSDSGVFNLALSGNDFSIVSDGGGAPMPGTLINGKIDINDGNVRVQGEFDGDHVEGTWKNTSNGDQGTWEGNRTL